MGTSDAGVTSSTRLYLGNLSRETTKRDIEKDFASTGAIKEIKLMNGFGFIEYQDAKDAKYLVPASYGSELRGQRITVSFAPIARVPRVKEQIHQKTTGPFSNEEGIAQRSSDMPPKSIVAHYTISRDLCGSQDSVATSMLSALAERSDDRSTILSRLAR